MPDVTARPVAAAPPPSSGSTATGAPGALTGRRTVLAVALAAALALLVPAAGGAAARTADDGSHEVVATGQGPVTVTATDGGVVELGNGTRLTGEIELHDGGLVVNRLHLEDYLLGIAEMPPSWPMEALKAQAVAARTYAARAVAAGVHRQRGRPYDICATVACQVFDGVAPVERPDGERWRRAVEATAGQVLLADGEPALTRYFSSSGGRTLPNELVFPDAGPRPYLEGVEDPDDAVSPLHRWQTVFPRDDMAQILARGERLSALGTLARVERDGSIWDPHATVALIDEEGERVELSAQELRRFVSDVAPAIDPDAYPPRREDGAARLPVTLPSARFEVRVDEQEVVFTGRGWGHGVGLGQHGARGKAERGLDHREILAAYYGGLAPTRPGELPEDLPDELAVGLDGPASTVLRSRQPMRIQIDGQTVTERALGPWRIEHDGATARVLAPADRDAALRVDLARVDDPPRETRALLELTLSKPAQVRLEIEGPEGGRVRTEEVGVLPAGRHPTSWAYAGADGEPVPAGRYVARVTARDEQGDAETARRALEVPAGPGSSSGRAPLMALAAALLVGAALAWRAARRRTSQEARG